MPDSAGERVSVAWERVVDVDGGCRIRARVTFTVRGGSSYRWSVEKLAGADADKASRGERITGGASRKRTEAVAAASAALSEAVRDMRRGERLGEGIVVIGRPDGSDRDPHTVTEASPDQPADVRPARSRPW